VIRIELDDATLSRTRIAISPLWEAQCSLSLLARNPVAVPWPYADWARRIRHLPATVAAVRATTPLQGSFPDFFSPRPQVAAPTIEDELAVIRATPPEVIAAQLARHYPDGTPPGLVPFQRDPEDALRCYTDTLLAYWTAAIEPYWPAMRAALDEEVLHRARALAAEGPDALLAGLHDRVRWQRPVLTLVKPHDQAFTAYDKRLLLIPLIFSRGALMCTTDDPDVVGVSYQARGAVVLAEATGPGAAGCEADRDRLAILVGRGRATVLRELAIPGTTAGLAARLGLAPSTVSEHLAALTAAGVANRRRAGRRVLYGLEPAGQALLALLDPPVAARAG
jgi:DNA-binding transcriptional ArsR family regulator